jgi:hypothetical protein
MSVPRIDNNSVVSWSSKAVAAEVNDEIVLMNLERDRCYGLGVIGSAIWRRLATPIRVSDVVSQLTQEYDATPGSIEADLLRTLEEMYLEGLLQVYSKDESLA